jgi:hypothetical protein
MLLSKLVILLLLFWRLVCCLWHCSNTNVVVYISMYLFPYNLTLTLFLHLLTTCFSRSCQFLSADPAIYILLAAECIEQIIHKAIIGLFLRILKDPDSVEYQLVLRQLAIKDCVYYSLFDVSFVVSETAPTQIRLFIFPCICFHITERWLCFCIFWPLVFPEVVNFYMYVKRTWRTMYMFVLNAIHCRQ